MYFIYREFSIAGWIALGVFLLYWAIVSSVRLVRRGRKPHRGFDVIQPPVEHPIRKNVDHHEDQP